MKPTSRIPTILRFAAALALLLALVGGEIGHEHAAFDSPDLCATCSLVAHSPTLPAASLVVVVAPEPRFALADADVSVPVSRLRAPTRSRAPPLA